MEILREYAVATTINFPLIGRGIQDFLVSPPTFATADTQVSQDEDAFANTGSDPVHEGRGSYSLALTGLEMTGARIVVSIVDVATKLWEDQEIIIQTYGHASAGLQELWTNLKQIDDSVTSAARLQASTAVILSFTVDDTVTPTSTVFETSDDAEATADHYSKRVIIFTSGDLINQARDITASSLVGGRERFTVTALTEAPADGDAFIIV